MANILVFGASITYGRWDHGGAGWVGRLRRHIDNINEERDMDHVVYNLGISGSDSNGILKRFKTEAEPRCWKEDKNVIIFSFGNNDSIINSDGSHRVEPKTYRKNLIQLISQAKKLSKEIIFIGLTPLIEEKVSPMPWSPKESYSNKNINKYDEILRNVCRKEKVQYLDLFSNLEKKEFLKHVDDGIHPNSKGHEIIYKIVKKFLKEKKYI